MPNRSEVWGFSLECMVLLLPNIKTKITLTLEIKHFCKWLCLTNKLFIQNAIFKLFNQNHKIKEMEQFLSKFDFKHIYWMYVIFFFLQNVNLPKKDIPCNYFTVKGEYRLIKYESIIDKNMFIQTILCFSDRVSKLLTSSSRRLQHWTKLNLTPMIRWCPYPLMKCQFLQELKVRKLVYTTTGHPTFHPSSL